MAAGAMAESRSNWATEAFKKNCESVVCIQGDKVEGFDGSRDRGRDTGKSYNGMGTGIIVDERGYIVTNFHVVEGIRKIQVTTFDRTQYTGTLLARDTDTDLAIIKINARKPLKTISLGRSHDLMPGENCLAIGNPYGYAFTLTNGQISGLERNVDVNDTLVYREAIQTNAEINPGNSGGPLINVDGEMIGITAAIRTEAVGIAFAIPVDQVIDATAKLLEEIGRQNATHGLRVRQESAMGASTGNAVFSSPGGRHFRVVVDSIESGTPAARSDFRKGDVITGVGDQSVHSVLDFYRALVELEPEDDIAMNVRRGGEDIDLVLSMGQAEDGAYAHAVRRNPVTPRRSPVTSKTARQAKSVGSDYDDLVWDVLGIRYKPIPTEEYQRDFPTKYPGFPHGGIVVKAVREGSAMARKGVTPDDVIVGIHLWTMTSHNDVQYVAKNWSTIRPDKETGKAEVEVLLFRGGQLYYVFIP